MNDDANVGKFIVFKIADYHLALPIGQVLKVINCSPKVSGGLNTMGLIQLGKHMVRVVDLHQQLTLAGSERLTSHLPFLMITRFPGGELGGIPVGEPPNLVELPLEMMHKLPPSDSYSQPGLNLMSHAAVVSQDNVTTTIFLLDLQQVLNATSHHSHRLALKPS